MLRRKVSVWLGSQFFVSYVFIDEYQSPRSQLRQHAVNAASNSLDGHVAAEEEEDDDPLSCDLSFLRNGIGKGWKVPQI